MEKDVTIQLTSINTIDGDASRTDLTTTGTFKAIEGGYQLRYEESEVTGFKGSTTYLSVFGNSLVNMRRIGTAPSDLTIEKGKKHHCHYGTPYGEFTMGIYTHGIVNKIDENGGELYFKYTVDINSSLVSDNEVYIKVN